MRFLSWVLAIAILAASIWTGLYLFKTRPSKPINVITEKAWAITSQTIKLNTITPSIPLYGRLEAPESVELKAAVVTEVVKVAITEGMTVNKGDLLIHLDPQEYQLQKKQRQADLDDILAQIAQQKRQQQYDKKSLPIEKRLLALNQTAVDRAEKLQVKNLGTQTATDQAKQVVLQQQLKITSRDHQIAQYPLRIQQLKAKREQRQALIAQAQLQLDRCQIHAPFAGIVAKLDIAEGMQVRLGDKLLQLYNPKKLRLRAQIPNAYLAQIEQQANNIALIAQQNDHTSWVLERLAGESKAQTAGIDGLFRLKTTNTQLRLGQFISVQLRLNPLKNVYQIPQAAIYEGHKIYIIKDERLQSKNIQILARVPETDGKRSNLLIRGDNLTTDMIMLTTQLPNAITGLKVKTMNH